MTALTVAGGTRIEWADYTFSPWWGCTKVPGSPACVHCYAERHAHRFGVGWGDGADRRPASENTWAQPARWDRKAAKDGVRRRVFCASMGDVFEARAELDVHRARLWETIDATPNLDWLLLTKRPENIFGMIPEDWGDEYHHNWPANVWVGVTAENQRWADARIPALIDIPAPVRFVSVEPMASRVDLTAYLPDLHWVICGGESGPKASPMHPSWPRDLRDQCVTAGVPFLFKQWGEWQDGSHWVNGKQAAPELIVSPINGTYSWSQWREMCGAMLGCCLVMSRVGKKQAGRVLDGRTWDQFPVVPQ